MATSGEFGDKVAAARSRFLRRLGALQKTFKEFKDATEFFSEFMELEADRRLFACRHFNNKYCNAWVRRGAISPVNRHNYEEIDDQRYLKDPSFLCAPCPLYEPKEISR